MKVAQQVGEFFAMVSHGPRYLRSLNSVAGSVCKGTRVQGTEYDLASAFDHNQISGYKTWL